MQKARETEQHSVILQKIPAGKRGFFYAGVFSAIQLTDGKKRVNGALRARAAVRPALRQGSAFLLGLAGGWAVLYGALMPFGLGLTLGFAEDCFAVGAAGGGAGGGGPGPHWGCWPGVSER